MGLFSYSGSDLVVNKWVGQLQLECGCQMSGTFIAKCVITSDMLKKKKSTAVWGITLSYHCITATYGPFFNILDL